MLQTLLNTKNLSMPNMTPGVLQGCGMKAAHERKAGQGLGIVEVRLRLYYLQRDSERA